MPGAGASASAGVVMRRLDINDGWIGRPLTALEAATSCRVAYLVRFGDALLPSGETVLQADDDVFFVIPPDAGPGAERTLQRPPGVKK